jgi:hypothetical protein
MRTGSEFHDFRCQPQLRSQQLPQATVRRHKTRAMQRGSETRGTRLFHVRQVAGQRFTLNDRYIEGEQHEAATSPAV